MKHQLTFIIGLAIFAACGRTDQVKAPDEPQQDALESLDAIAEVSPETGEPPAIESLAPVLPAEIVPADEAIVPPSQVTGAYLVARLIQTQETRVEVGLTAFYQGQRVSLKPQMFTSKWSVSASADQGVTAVLGASAVADHDYVLEFTGESLKAIKQQLAIVQISLTVSDLLVNKTEAASVQTVEMALNESAKREGAEPPVVEAMPQELDPNL